MAKENIRQMTHNNVDKVMDKAESMRDNVIEKAEGFRENSTTAFNNAKEKAGMMRNDFDGYISSNPEKSVLIAAGVGAVVGIALTAAMMKKRN
ncbi:MAG: hypothetical protein V1859_06820 [archaeon]